MPKSLNKRTIINQISIKIIFKAKNNKNKLL